MDELTLDKAQTMVTRMRTTLLMKDPALTRLCLLIPIAIRLDLDAPDYVAYTDGFGITLCKRWFAYTLKEQTFIYLHELSHIIYQHVKIREQQQLHRKDAYLYNVATDAVINFQLETATTDVDIYTVPPDAISIRYVTQQLPDSKQYSDWTSWDLFLALRRLHSTVPDLENESEGQSACSKHNNGNSDSTEPSRPKSLDGLSAKSRNTLNKRMSIKDFSPDLMEGDQRNYDLTEEQRDFAALPDEAKSTMLRKLLTAGTGSSNILRAIASGLPAPTVNWHNIVRAFLRSYCTVRYRDNWRRPNRLTLAHAIDHFEPARGPCRSLYRVGWIVDTSASMSSEELFNGLRLIASCRTQYNFELILLSADAAVCSREVIKAQVDFERRLKANAVTLKGGGGTDFRPALNAIEQEHPTLVFYYTDGYGVFPENVSFPLVWLMTTDVKAPVGKTIRVQ